MDRIHVPISRFRRELKKWIRFLSNNPDRVIFLTRNGIENGAIISPDWYENFRTMVKNNES